MSVHETAMLEAFDAAVGELGLKVSAGLPDDWTRPLLDHLRGRGDVAHVDVAREAEAVAIVAGAFLTGAPSAAVMGATGLLTCLGELATLHVRHHIPALLLVSERGTPDDGRIYQEVQGRRLKPALDALDIPWLRVDDIDGLRALPHAQRWGRVQKRPLVVFLSRALLRDPEAPGALLAR